MNYIIIFDNSQIQYDPQEIHRFVTKSPYLNDWWHYLPNVYIIVTDMSAKRMADSTIAQFPGLRFLISKIDLSDNNGVLKKGAWDWINSKTQSKDVKLKVSPNPKPWTIEDILSLPRPSQPQSNQGLNALEDLLGLTKKTR